MGIQVAVTELLGRFEPVDQVEVEVVAAGAPVVDERHNSDESRQRDEEQSATWRTIMRHPCHRGLRVSVWVMVLCVAAGVKGSEYVVPWSQSWNWSMYHWLAGSPDWPRTMFSVVRSGSLKSVVKRSEGPNARCTCLTVVPSTRPGGRSNQPLEEHGPGEDGVLNIDREGFALLPGAEIFRRVGVVQTTLNDGGEEVVPVGITGWEPARRRMGYQLFLHTVSFAPNVGLPEISRTRDVRWQVPGLG